MVNKAGNTVVNKLGEVLQLLPPGLAAPGPASLNDRFRASRMPTLESLRRILKRLTLTPGVLDLPAKAQCWLEEQR